MSSNAQVISPPDPRGYPERIASELPALAGLLSGLLPTEVPYTGVAALAAECGRVDWNALDGPALGGFAALSLVVSQAAGQAGAGLRFAPDAEPGAVADRGPM